MFVKRKASSLPMLQPPSLSQTEPMESSLSLLPSREDVRAYRERGWYVSPRLFSDDELASVQEASEEFYAGHRDRTLPTKPPPSAYWDPDHGDVQRHNDYICYENASIFGILCKPLIGQVAARLIGTDLVRLWSSTLIYKPARLDEPTNVVPWHKDRHHWEVCTSDELLTAFIPLHDCDETNGTLIVVDGSHKWKELPPADGDDPTLHFVERPRSALDAALQENANFNDAEICKIPLIIPKGCVSFHHCRTFHASGPNRKPFPRRVVTVRFQEESNRWRPFERPEGGNAVYNHDVLVRKTPEGNPDYTDPEYCPVLWETGDASR